MTNPGRDEPATGTTTASWDLDAGPVDPAPFGAGGGALVLLLAVGLAGLGIGALAGSSLASDPGPRFPPGVNLQLRDSFVDLTGRPGRAGLRTGNAVVVLRLEVNNPGPAPIRATGLVVDGVASRRARLPLSLPVPGHGRATVDLTLRADCSPERQPVAVSARLILAGRAAEVPATPARLLGREGGLCTTVDGTSPSGWRTPIQAVSSRVEDEDLVIEMEDLSGLGLDGILLDGQLIPTVFVGDQFLRASARIQPGQRTLLRLRGPPPCVRFAGSTPIPSTLRFLAQKEGSIQPRLVVVGPEMARWISSGC